MDMSQQRYNPDRIRIMISSISKWLLITAGSISLLLGIIGIFIPLLPTTPFLLISAACYARSSERLYNWLLKHALLGNYIRLYREKKAIPLKAKVIVISMMWLTIGTSSIFVVDEVSLKVILILIAIVTTIFIIRLNGK